MLTFCQTLNITIHLSLTKTFKVIEKSRPNQNILCQHNIPTVCVCKIKNILAFRMILPLPHKTFKASINQTTVLWFLCTWWQLKTCEYYANFNHVCCVLYLPELTATIYLQSYWWSGFQYSVNYIVFAFRS